MKKIKQLAGRLEEKSGQALVKITMVIFLFSLLVGFLSGLFFRELRLNLLEARQRAQKMEEERRLSTLSEKYSQIRLSPKK